MDRTPEFRSAVEAIRVRSTAALPEAKQRLLANGSSSSKAERRANRSEFAKQAAAIAREIQNTQAKLEKLAQLAKRKTLFDDRPVEISELTFIIKRDIANLNGAIGQLQQLSRARPSGSSAPLSRQQEEHNSNVVVMLQGQLASASLAFKDVLEIRTQNMKASRTRTEQFGGAVAAASTSNEPPNVLRSRKSLNADSPLYAAAPKLGADVKGKGRATNSDFLMLDMAGGGATTQGGAQSDGGFMQLQQMEEQDNSYLQSRSTAIESIESTIAELGQIFGQLAHMVQAQGETVQRIDTDTSDIAHNVSGAQSELLKYYASVSSNRMLMLKVFGVLIIAFLLFTLVS